MTCISMMRPFARRWNWPVDTSSAAVRDYFAQSAEQTKDAVDTLLLHNRIDCADVATDADYVACLIKLFKKR